MIEVDALIISLKDGQWGIRRQFPFSFDVITPKDEELKAFITDAIKKFKKSIHLSSSTLERGEH